MVYLSGVNVAFLLNIVVEESTNKKTMKVKSPKGALFLFISMVKYRHIKITRWRSL